MVCWGTNANGECAVPAGLTNVVAVAAGGYFSMALKSDGTVVTWGFDYDGAVSGPRTVTGVTAIAAGDLHTLVLKRDGSVAAFGYDGDGQTDIPAGLTDVAAIAAGGLGDPAEGGISFVLRRDGSITWYGRYRYGNGASTGQTTPPGLGAVAISSGYNWVMAIFASAQDTTPPVVTAPAPVTVEATGRRGASVTYGAASAVDAQDGAVPASCSPASGSEFPVGVTTVTCTAKDLARNVGTARFTVTVRDTTAPLVGVPASVAVDATSPAGAIVAVTPVALDLVDGSVPVTCSPEPGTLLPIGVTTVTCTATDRAGNAAKKSFTVTVRGATEQAAALERVVRATGVADVTTLAGKVKGDVAVGDTASARTHLGKLRTAVAADLRAGALTRSQAATLDHGALTLLAVLG